MQRANIPGLFSFTPLLIIVRMPTFRRYLKWYYRKQSAKHYKIMMQIKIPFEQSDTTYYTPVIIEK